MARSVVTALETPTLQQASKAFARARICDAARELFFREGYGATTLEKIAIAAGTRRTTLYSHFRDKADILEAIGSDYYDGLCRLAGTIPGPMPSRVEIDAWVSRLVDYVVQERAPATLLIGLGMAHEQPAQTERWSRRFLETLAARLPAFARAIGPAATPRRRAWARVVLRELSLACLEAANEENADSAILDVACDLFETFVRDRA